jgi:hypothetical protein
MVPGGAIKVWRKVGVVGSSFLLFIVATRVPRLKVDTVSQQLA